MVSAIMQSVSGEKMSIELARNGGVSFIYGSQSPEDEAAMVARVKAKKAGFVPSDSNLSPENTLADVLALKAKTGHSTIAITEDGTSSGKMVGIVSSRDYRVSRMDRSEKVKNFMTPVDKLVKAKYGITLSEANDIIWDNKINSLPVLYEDGRLYGFVFRKDYDSHQENPNEMLDSQKRFVVGAGINSRDYEERVPLLLEAGADVLCIDSSEGFSEWQKITLEWIHNTYGEKVKVGAGNVVDRDGFLFLAKAGADFVKVGIGGAPSASPVRQRALAAARLPLSLKYARQEMNTTKKPASMYRYAPTAASYMTTTSPSHSLWALTSSCSADTLHASTNPQPRPEPLAAQSSKNTGAKVPTEPETGHAMTSAEKRNSSSKKALTPTFLTLVRSKTTSKRPALRSKLPCATAALSPFRNCSRKLS